MEAWQKVGKKRIDTVAPKQCTVTNRAGQQATLTLDAGGKLVIGSERVISRQTALDCPVSLKTHTGSEWYVSEEGFEHVTDMSPWEQWIWLGDYFHRR